MKDYFGGGTIGDAKGAFRFASLFVTFKNNMANVWV